jgi:tetratricopeptide (TPR) repeat protein
MIFVPYYRPSYFICIAKISFMMKWIFSLTLIIGCSYASAQQKIIDSLTSILKSNSNNDTSRLNLLIQLAGLTFSSNPDRSLSFADEAIEIATSLQRKDKLAEALTNKGNSYWAKGQDEEARNAYIQAFHQYKNSGNEYGQAKIYNNLGLLSFNQGEYSKALEYHMEALPIFLKLKHHRGIANTYNNAGVVLQYLGDYPQALDYYLKAMRIFQERAEGNEEGLANAYMNVGIMYKNLRDFDKALEYHHKALSQYEKLGNKQGIANAFGNIGNVFSLTNQRDTSLSYYHRALHINEEIGNSRRIASDLSNIGAAHAAARDFTPSIQAMEQAKKLYEQLNDKNSLSSVLAQLAEIYSQVPASILTASRINPSTRKAVVSDYYGKAISMATSINAIDRQSEIYLSMSNSYERMGNFTQALEAFKKHAGLQDSLLNSKKQKEIVRKEIQFAFDKKEAILNNNMHAERLVATSSLRAEKLKFRFGLVAVIVLISLAALITLLYKKRRDAEEEKKESDLKAQMAETEMKALRSQMNPHFIYNSLNSIIDYIDKREVATATAYVAKFSKLMRMILEHSEKQEVSLSDDLLALELYMQLEAHRLNNKFTYEIIVSDEIDPETTLIPPMILQPFVENSIWHGLVKLPEQGRITIRISKQQEVLTCIVEDNGAGRKSQEYEVALSGTKTSLGLKITQARIDLLNKLKKVAAGFVLTDLERGVRVEVNLPYQTAF